MQLAFFIFFLFWRFFSLPELFYRQKDLLDTFPATGSVSQVKYNKSLNCLIEKWMSREKIDTKNKMVYELDTV